MGGVKNAFGKRWDYFKNHHKTIEEDIISILSEKNKEGEAIEKIKNYLSSKIHGYGFSEKDPYFSYLYHHSYEIDKKNELEYYIPEIENLRNPIVQRSLNETRKLVNFLLKHYRNIYGDDFRFDVIKVELGRDLKNSKTQRANLYKQIKINEEKNEEARKKLIMYGLKPSRENIQKYLLWKEIEDKSGIARCPYTGKTISISDLFSPFNLIQIEHIVPKSVSLDDSITNKTLCESNFNNAKGNKTPYQFYKENQDRNLWGADSWESIVDRAFSLLPYNKAKLFTSKQEHSEQDFITRQLNDTRYISKKTAEILKKICSDVRVLPGTLTAELRHLWGLNNVLSIFLPANIQKVMDKAEIGNYYLILDQHNNIVDKIRKENDPPETGKDEILISVRVKENKVEFDLFKINDFTTKYKDGDYWVKVRVDDNIDNIKIDSKYVPKPICGEDKIVFRGRIENKKFHHDTLTYNGRIDKENGKYWAVFNVNDKKFIEAIKNTERPEIKQKNQILLFGNVNNGIFSCYIYNCSANLPDGKYWIIIDLDLNSAEFIKVDKDRPSTNHDEICLIATINDNSTLVLDDYDKFRRQIDEQKSGKYYAILKVVSQDEVLYPMFNEFSPKKMRIL